MKLWHTRNVFTWLWCSKKYYTSSNCTCLTFSHQVHILWQEGLLQYLSVWKRGPFFMPHEWILNNSCEWLGLKGYCLSRRFNDSCFQNEQWVNVKLPMANARGQGPIAKCQLQCAIAKCQGQIANCKGPRARNFTQEGPTPIKNIPTLEKNQGFDSKGFEFQSWIAMVLVQISIGQCQGAKGQRPIAENQLRLHMAHCQGQIARGQGQGISH